MSDVLLVGTPSGPLGKLDSIIVQDNAQWSVCKIATMDGALEQLELRPADVMVAALGDDVSIYQQFFGEAAAVSPRTLRFALFDESTTLPDRVLNAHQVVTARKDMHHVVPMLAAASKVAERADTHRELRRIISQLHDVPSPPTLYFDIREQIENLSGDLTGMAAATAKDPGLVARILKIANSGFYGVPRTISDLSEAVGLIGTDALLGMVLAAHLFTGLPPPGLKLELLWQHTLRVSMLARLITQHEGGTRAEQSVSAVAGLLHDIGIMVLLENEPAQYQPIWRRSGGDEQVLAQMESDAFGVTHGELGALILMLWSLPDDVVNAVAHSHAVALTDQAELPLSSRAVQAAEWLLDDTPDRRVPECASEISENTLTRWQEMRDEVALQGVPF